MNDYPMLYFLMRWGRFAAAGLAGVVVVAGVLLSISTGNWLWTLAGGIVAAIGYGLALSYVELVKVIVDMLLPKP
jgi:putative flippase GtrA